MIYQSTAYTYFSISGKKFDSRHFIEEIDVNPTQVGQNRLGEKFLEYKIEATDANEGLDKAIELLQRNLSPKAKRIKQYASQKDLYVKIFVVIKSENSEDNGVFLNQEFIQFLCEIGAEMEIDTYHG